MYTCGKQIRWFNGLFTGLYYREYGLGEVREECLAVIQWILTEHYQKGSVSEELLKEMLFWSCRYVCTYFST